jgi:hypothetical protein
LNFIKAALICFRNGVDVDGWSEVDEGYCQTLLHRAIDENKIDTAKFLIRYPYNLVVNSNYFVKILQICPDLDVISTLLESKEEKGKVEKRLMIWLVQCSKQALI